MKKIKVRYGNEVFYINYGIGILGLVMVKLWLLDQSVFVWFMNMWGGYFDYYSDYLIIEIIQVYLYFYGLWVGSNLFDDVKNFKFQVMFGNNFVEICMLGGG